MSLYYPDKLMAWIVLKNFSFDKFPKSSLKCVLMSQKKIMIEACTCVRLSLSCLCTLESVNVIIAS